MPGATELTLGQLFWYWLATTVVSYTIARVLAPDLDLDEGDKRQGHLQTIRDTQAAIILPYGRCRVATNQVYLGTTGSDNEYLHMIGILGEGPVKGILRQDEETIYETTGEALPTDNPPLVYFGDELFTAYDANLVHIEFFNGSSVQNTCATLNTAIPDWDEPQRYTSYIYVRLKYDREDLPRLPAITLVLEGLELYNPVTSTTAYSNNAALCAYHFMTHPSTRGGMGISLNRINTTELSEAIDYCTDKGWTCNMPITDNQYAIDNLNLILANFRGAVIMSDNEIKITFRDLNYEAVVANLIEDDLVDVGGEASLVIEQPDIFDRPNTIRAKYLSGLEHKYQINDYVYTDQTALANDGDYRELAVAFYGLSELDLVQKMAFYALERSRLNKQISFTARAEFLKLEPLDIITLTHSTPGWDQKLMRIVTAKPNEDFTMSLTAIEEATILYDDIYNLSAEAWYDTNLPAPTDDVPSVTNASSSEETYYYRGRTFTRWIINFSPPTAVVYPWWSYAEIFIKIGAGDYKLMTTAYEDYILDPVEEGETYYCKIRSVNIYGKKENINSAVVVSKTIFGYDDIPSDLTYLTAVANGDTVSIYSDEIPDTDIVGYEIRLGETWAGGILMSVGLKPSLRLVGVRPGTHVFWMSPLDNDGNYSDNPVSAEVTVFIPPGYTELPTFSPWPWDFSTGKFCNCHQYTDGGAVDWLRVSSYENLLEDGGFENGDFSVWDSVGNSVIESSIVRTGSYSAKLVAPAGSRLGCYTDYEVDPQTSYNVVQWVNITNFVKNRFNACAVSFYDEVPGFIGQAEVQILSDPGSGWKEYSLTIGPIGEDVDVEIPVNCKFMRVVGGGEWWNGTGDPEGTAYVDDVSFQRADVQAIEYGTCESEEPTCWGRPIYSERGSHARDTGWAASGTYSMKYTGDGAGVGGHYLYIPAIEVTPWGVNYTISVDVYIPNGNTVIESLTLSIRKTDRSGAVTGVDLDSTTTKGSKVTLSGTTVFTENERLSRTHQIICLSPTTANSESFYADNWSAIQENKLVGKYISPTHDLNAIEKVRIWGDFITSFISGGTTFGGVMGIIDTFGDHDADTKSFAEIFEPSIAGQLKAVLLHSEDNSTWYTKEFFEILCAEVEARYIACEVTITNPTNDSSLMLEELDMVAYEGPQ
jgi:hypothetical protein